AGGEVSVAWSLPGGIVEWAEGREAVIRTPQAAGEHELLARVKSRGGDAVATRRIEIRQVAAETHVAPRLEQVSPSPYLQRTMRLLASSTDQQRNEVRVLFYGQSITKQDWWWQVADNLQRRFPQARLVIENRAIGGYSAPYLLRTVERDMVTFLPDLVLFHVYGPRVEYEQVIRTIRTRTAAEVAIQTDHVNGVPTDEQQKTREAMSFEFLPELAARYGCALIDVRRPWQRYMDEHQLTPKDLQKDGVHLNGRGNFLLAEIVKPYLVHDPRAQVREAMTMVKAPKWKKGRMVLEFEGVRVDAVGESGDAELLFDGTKPSEDPTLFSYTRPTATWDADWPCVNHVSWRTVPLVEDWRVRVLEANDDLSAIRFRVTGSKTGEDGEGFSNGRFVSASGRVVLEPGDWAMKRSFDLRKTPMPKDWEFGWRVVPLFADRYRPGTLIGGCTPGVHRLELVAGAQKPKIKGFRVWRPLPYLAQR
ncbi:MAG: SGNH/GDSL hydrolase family protein, partial [Bryobacterales bacterium]|nr:SGNH/GDSL hydrolase family protein [Bryobacterales bacterium]